MLRNQISILNSCSNPLFPLPSISLNTPLLSSYGDGWGVKFCSSLSLFPLSTALLSSPSTALTKNMYGFNSRPSRPHICYISVCYLCYNSFTDSVLPVLLLFYCFFHLCLRVQEQYLAALLLYPCARTNYDY